MKPVIQNWQGGDMYCHRGDISLHKILGSNFLPFDLICTIKKSTKIQNSTSRELYHDIQRDQLSLGQRTKMTFFKERRNHSPTTLNQECRLQSWCTRPEFRPPPILTLCKSHYGAIISVLGLSSRQQILLIPQVCTLPGLVVYCNSPWASRQTPCRLG